MTTTSFDGFKDTFREEAKEQLAALEESLLVMEDRPNDPDEVSAVFRIMHTIKGSSAMFGFDFISNFTHELESLFEKVRKKEVESNSELIGAMLMCKDFIAEQIFAVESEETETVRKRANELLRAVFTAVSQQLPDTIKKTGSTSPYKVDPCPEETPDCLRTYRIRFNPHADIFQNGTRPLNLIEELGGLGEVSVIADTGDLPEFDRIDPETCYFRWDILLTTRNPEAEIREVFLFVQDTADVLVDIIDIPEEQISPDELLLGSILLRRGMVTKDRIEEAVKKQRRIGTVLIEEGVRPHEIRAALDEQEHLRKTRGKIQGETTTSTIRVASEKLDSLVDLVGELVTLQARLSQTSDHLQNSVLVSIAEQLERLTEELRDNTMNLRMLPIGTTFTRFRRLIRDLSQELGKEIEFLTEGGETELDKTILDRLNDPLVHLIRNCIDHGIEDPQQRTSKGKTRMGMVSLRAEHSGASVLIIIEDDGQGLDQEKIRMKAIERGLLAPNAVPTRDEVFQFLLAPGFSTASEVTHLSGRGVGMDVVKREIEALGGTLTIESETGSYTRMTLAIPLTLAIIDGLLIRVGDERYIFPLAIVEECLAYSGSDRTDAEVFSHRGKVVPLVKLRTLFDCGGPPAEKQQVVVVKSGDSLAGIVVDAVIGGHQTVVKGLGRMYRNAEGISGATILGDGTIALILDVNRLMKLAAA